MQTFLPLPDFRESARSLDRLRLGKQRVEVLQILKAIRNGGGWANHPATNMWRGYEGALIRYGHEACLEWIRRGYRDTCDAKIQAFELDFDVTACSYELPYWFGDDRLHLSHQSNLVRKQAEYYRPLFPDVPDDLPYWWPPSKQNRQRL